jgi:drug/metabolite transporter (DMT)-like permease
VIYLGLLLTMLFWGGTFIAGRILAASVPPPDAAFTRFVLAAVTLAFLTRLIDGHLRLPPKSQLVGLLLLGLTGVFSYNICFFSGLRYIEAGRASLIIALNPMAITIGAVLLYGERLSLLQCVGLLISLCGAFLVISNGDPAILFSGGFGWGETAIIGCVISWAAYSLIGRSVLKAMTPLSAVFYSALFGALMLFPATLVDGSLPNPGSYAAADWLSLLFLGILGTAAGFTLYYRAITKIGAARSSVFINLVPLFSILLAWLFLAETVNLSVLFGGAILMTGVYLTNRKAKTRILPRAKKAG